jgi:hypothetical protein
VALPGCAIYTGIGSDHRISVPSPADGADRGGAARQPSQYKAGLSTRLNVLQARVGAISTEQALTNLRMSRRDQQIGLAAALGGGFTDASDAQNRAAGKDAPFQSGLTQSSR